MFTSSRFLFTNPPCIARHIISANLSSSSSANLLSSCPTAPRSLLRGNFQNVFLRMSIQVPTGTKLHWIDHRFSSIAINQTCWRALQPLGIGVDPSKMVGDCPRRLYFIPLFIRLHFYVLGFNFQRFLLLQLLDPSCYQLLLRYSLDFVLQLV